MMKDSTTPLEKPKSSENIPASIKEATPYNFEVSKNDLNDPNSGVEFPEKYVEVIITEWMRSITSELQRSTKPEAWAVYHRIFARKVIMANEQFPTSLPIGYVLVCFFMSAYPIYYEIDKVKKIFNAWIGGDDTRKKMFEAYRAGKFYFSPADIDVEETTDQPDGLQVTKALYDTTQQDMFNQND